MNVEEFKEKVLNGFYQEHPQGKQLLDIDYAAVTQPLAEQVEELEEQIALLEDTVFKLEETTDEGE